MAAPRRYELPHVQLRRLLMEAKLEGLSFDEAWERAVRPGKPVVMTNATNPPAGAVRWPTDTADRTSWLTSILETEGAWESAYEGWPATEAEQAVAQIGGAMAALGGMAGGAPVASAA